MAYAVRTAVRGADLPINLLFLDETKPDIVEGDLTPAYFWQQQPDDNSGFNDFSTRMAAFIAFGQRNAAENNFANLYLYTISADDYLRYSAGVFSPLGALTRNFNAMAFTKESGKLRMAFLRPTLTPTQPVFYATIDGLDYRGGTIAGAIPAVANISLDFGNGAITGDNFTGPSALIAGTTETDPVMCLYFSPAYAAAALSHFVYGAKYNDAGVTAIQCFDLQLDFLTDYGGISSGIPTLYWGDVNYSFIRLDDGGGNEISLFSIWQETAVGDPFASSIWEATLADATFEAILEANWSNMKNTAAGFLVPYNDGAEIKALLIDIGWTTFQLVTFASAIPEIQALIDDGVNADVIIDDAGIWYLSKTDAAGNAVIARSATLSLGPRITATPVALPCQVTCIPVFDRRIRK